MDKSLILYICIFSFLAGSVLTNIGLTRYEKKTKTKVALGKRLKAIIFCGLGAFATYFFILYLFFNTIIPF